MNNVLRAASVGGIVVLLAGTASFGPVYPEAHTAGAALSHVEGPNPADAHQAPTTPGRDDAGPPELPRVIVDVPAIAITGRTIHVTADGNLQKAIDDAKP